MQRMRASTIKPLRHIAVMTKQLKVCRITVPFNPQVKSIAKRFSVYCASMFSAVIIFMVYRKKLLLAYATANTLSAVVGQNFTSNLLAIAFLAGAIASDSILCTNLLSTLRMSSDPQARFFAEQFTVLFSVSSMVFIAGCIIAHGET